MSATAIFFPLILLLPASPAINPNPWELVRKSDGITVWARDVPRSSVREVKAEATIEASSRRVFDVLLDIDHYTEFMPYLTEARIVGSAGKRARYVYQRMDPPLVDERDYTLRVSGDGDEGSGLYFLNWSSANDQGPPKEEDVVRIEICNGSWTIEQLADGKANATYYLHTDPGGTIPAWIANLANTRSVPDLMAAVRERALDPSWRIN